MSPGISLLSLMSTIFSPNFCVMCNIHPCYTILNIQIFIIHCDTVQPVYWNRWSRDGYYHKLKRNRLNSDSCGDFEHFVLVMAYLLGNCWIGNRILIFFMNGELRGNLKNSNMYETELEACWVGETTWGSAVCYWNMNVNDLVKHNWICFHSKVS